MLKGARKGAERREGGRRGGGGGGMGLRSAAPLTCYNRPQGGKISHTQTYGLPLAVPLLFARGVEAVVVGVGVLVNELRVRLRKCVCVCEDMCMHVWI